jgi:polar amino acid transport system substrate-binding protein
MIQYICLFLLLLMPIANSSAKPKYTFYFINGLAGQRVAGRLLVDIYKRAGMEVSVEAVPADRAYYLALKDNVDGEVGRTFSYSKRIPTLIRVPTSFTTLDTTAFALKKRNIHVKSKADLSKYHIAMIRGVQHTLDATAGLSNIEILNNLESLMLFINAGRADIALTDKLTGLIGLKNIKNLKDGTIIPVGTLETLELYNYVSPKLKFLVPTVDAAIKKIKDSGELSMLRAKYEQEELNM